MKRESSFAYRATSVVHDDRNSLLYIGFAVLLVVMLSDGHGEGHSGLDSKFVIMVTDFSI